MATAARVHHQFKRCARTNRIVIVADAAFRAPVARRPRHDRGAGLEPPSDPGRHRRGSVRRALPRLHRRAARLAARTARRTATSCRRSASASWACTCARDAGDDRAATGGGFAIAALAHELFGDVRSPARWCWRRRTTDDDRGRRAMMSSGYGRMTDFHARYRPSDPALRYQTGDVVRLLDSKRLAWHLESA